MFIHSLEKQRWMSEKHSNQFCTGQKPHFSPSHHVLIYLQPQIRASFWRWRNAADLTDTFLCAQLDFEDVKVVQSKHLQSVIARDTSCTKSNSLEQSQVLESRTVLSHHKHNIPVESNENSGGGEGFESRIYVPHDSPCEQRPQISLQ